jgi:hypothetical protein
LDSTITANYGEKLIVKSYIAKDSVEKWSVNNLGESEYIVYRYITDTLQRKPFEYSSTYSIAYEANKMVTRSDNLTFISLVNPVSINTNWKGNERFNYQPPSPYYFYDNWSYGYQNINENFTTLKGVIPNTTTVLQNNFQLPETGYDPNQYNEKSYSKEVYAKGIGLVYKEILHYIYQVTPERKFQDDSYGIKLNLIDYK